jgi:hypothetical protein
MIRYLSIQFPTSGLTLPDGTAITIQITRNALIPILNISSVQVAPQPDPQKASQGAISALSLVVNVGGSASGIFYLGNLTNLNDAGRLGKLMNDYAELKKNLADDSIVVVEVTAKDYDQ